MGSELSQNLGPFSLLPHSTPLQPLLKVGASRAALLLALLLGFQLIIVASVIAFQPPVTAQVVVQGQGEVEGAVLPPPSNQNPAGQFSTTTRAAFLVSRDFVVNLALLWGLWSCIGFAAGVGRGSATSVLAALAIGQIVATFAFALRYLPLVLSGAHSGEISFGSIAASTGLDVPSWMTRVGPFHIWSAWAFGAALASSWRVRQSVMITLAMLSMILWRLDVVHW